VKHLCLVYLDEEKMKALFRRLAREFGYDQTLQKTGAKVMKTVSRVCV
jgi:hypothetical protein